MLGRWPAIALVGATITLAAVPAIGDPSYSSTMTDVLSTVGEKVMVTVSAANTTIDVDSRAAGHRYPDRTRRLQQGGDVGFRCGSDDHRLVNCIVTSEAPINFGFGMAALAVLQSDAVSVPAEMNRHAISGTVSFRIADHGRLVRSPNGG
jgi:hypothetical protein